MTVLGDNTPGNYATRSDVREMGRDIKDHFVQLLKQQQERGDEKHRDNLERMDDRLGTISDGISALVAEQKTTNGRVTTLEAVTKLLQDDFQSIRKRWHDFRDSLQNRCQEIHAKLLKPDKENSGGTGENRTVNMRDVYVFVAGVGLFYAFAKLLKWIP